MPWPWNRDPKRAAHGQVIRASAYKAKIGERGGAAQRIARQEWQAEAFEYVADLGVVKYPILRAGNAMAKLRLFAAVRPLDDPEGTPIPVTDPDSGIPTPWAMQAQAEIERIKGATGGRGEILRMLNVNLKIAGQAWIIGTGPRSHMVDDPQRPGEQMELVTLESWDVRSILEVEEKADGTTIIHAKPGDTGTKLDPELDEAITIFQRSAGWARQADSHMRGVLVDCQALVLLQNEILAESKSRQSNGLFTVPNELGNGPALDTEGEDGAGEAGNDPLMDAISEALIDPIEDPSSAASVVPTFLRGPGEWLHPNYLRHITFHRDTTAVLEDRINGRVQSIARGLNWPVETTVGHQSTTFANAASIDESEFEDHLRPDAELIVDGWTTTLLQPHLIDAGVPPDVAERIIVWYDPIDLIKRVDPADSADKGVELDTISDAAWRTAKGWSDDDAPEPLDRLIRAILKGRFFPPELVDAVVGELEPGIDIPAPTSTATAQPFAATARTAALTTVLNAAQAHDARLLASRAAAALARDNPGRKLAALDRDLRTKTLIAANAAMVRALEKAGNRLKAKAGPHKAALRTINPIYAAAHLGPTLVASAGFVDEDLIGVDAFDGAVAQFDAWTAHAQEKALAIAAGVVTLSGSEKEHVRQTQRSARADAGVWLKAALLGLAAHKLYAPDELPTVGEFDPTLKIPAGLVREAIAIAGGAQGIEQKTDGSFVAQVNGQPLGQVGNGETITTTMTDAGALVQGIEWDYGPGERQHPFEPHEELDGVIFTSFGDDVLAANESEGWVGITGTSLFPGDHDGCQCEWVLVWVPPDEIADDTELVAE